MLKIWMVLAIIVLVENISVEARHEMEVGAVVVAIALTIANKEQVGQEFAEAFQRIKENVR